MLLSDWLENVLSYKQEIFFRLSTAIYCINRATLSDWPIPVFPISPAIHEYLVENFRAKQLTFHGVSGGNSFSINL